MLRGCVLFLVFRAVKAGMLIAIIRPSAPCGFWSDKQALLK
jgi:hypothetical protein